MTRVQTKKNDPRVGSWDWYHIKSWDTGLNHFAFKIVGTGCNDTNYVFDTEQVCERRIQLFWLRSCCTGSLSIAFAYSYTGAGN